MAISKLPQAPFRQDTRVFPTPLIGDVLFSELRDCTRIEVPAYGTPHPDSKKWPDHKLIFVKQIEADQRDGLFEFYYAADRENQDLYNFAYGQRTIEGREFRVVNRTYITPRSDFKPADIEFGTPMPDLPKGKFSEATYVFYDKQQQRLQEQELDALYVTEVHSYVESSVLNALITARTEKTLLVPDKFQASVPVVTTETLVEGSVSTPTLDSDDVRITEQQINPNLKRVENISRAPRDTPVVLQGSQAYVEGTVAVTTDEYSPGELTPDSGLLVVSSETEPLGDGSFVKKTVTVPEWPVLTSSEWNHELNAPIVTREQFVDPPGPTDLNTPNVSYKAINKDRSLRIEEVSPEAQLDSYVSFFPVEVNLQLPNELLSIVAIWAGDVGNGNYNTTGDASLDGDVGGSLSISDVSEASSSASVKGDLVVNIQQPWGSDLPATAYYFFAKTTNNSLTQTQLIARLASLSGLNVQRWPVFKPQGHTLVCTGKDVRITARVNATLTGNYKGGRPVELISRERSQGQGSSIDVGTSVQTIEIPPTIHGSIPIGNSKSPGLTANANVDASVNLTQLGRLNPRSNISRNINGQVSPSNLSPTRPAAIPRSGHYLIQSRIEPYRWGWVKCYAVVFDASVLN
jgi:hypothetical protein